MKKTILGQVPLDDLKNSCGTGGSAAADVYHEMCPSRAVLELIADKWTMLILPSLRQGPRRNGDLLRFIGGVSQKMLTQTLRELERNGLVRRIDYAEVPPRVEYELTPLGRSLAEVVRKLDGWAQQHMLDVQSARTEFAAREKRTSALAR